MRFHSFARDKSLIYMNQEMIPLSSWHPLFSHVVFNDTVNGSLCIIMIVPIIIFWIVSWPVSFNQETTSSVIQTLTSFKFWFSSATLPIWKNLLSMGRNSSAIVLPVAGKPTEIARKTLVYNEYFHLSVFCFSGLDEAAEIQEIHHA